MSEFMVTHLAIVLAVCIEMDALHIRRILPNKDSEVYIKIYARLRELGVYSVEQARLLSEKDLSGVLLPIPARMLIVGFRKQYKLTIKHSNSSTSLESTPNTASRSGNSDASRCCSFQVPWQSFPQRLIQCCLNNEVPPADERKQMVRILVDKILDVKRNPKRKYLDTIASAIVSKYPNSFMDRMCGAVIGSGHERLTDQLFYRVRNVNRKMKSRNAYQSTKNSSVEKRKKHDVRSYGCINWSPPITNAIEMEVNRMWLLEESRKTHRDTEKAKMLMTSTYPLQRSTINERVPVSTIIARWPVLFEDEFMFQHFSILTGKKHAKEFIVGKMDSVCCRIRKALEDVKSLKVLNALSRISTVCDLLGSESYAFSFGMLDLLCAYFDEPTSQLFKPMEIVEGRIVAEAPSHPFLIAVGSTIFYAKEFVVTVERSVIFLTDSFYCALAYLFVAFYVFNVEYPQELRATLEFMQRLFAEISDDGSKYSTKKKIGVHPKVLKLVMLMRKTEV